MPLKRTPPTTPAMSHSDTDIPSLSETQSSGSRNTTTRYKRLRQDDSPPVSELGNFKQEIKEMFETLRLGQAAQVAQFSKLSADVTEIKEQYVEIKRTNQDIDKNLEQIRQTNEDNTTMIANLIKENLELRNQMSIMQNIIDNFELNSRSSSVEFRNIPGPERETVEQLSSFIISTGDVIQVPIGPADIRDIYRLPAKSGNIKPIVVEFNRVALKSHLLAAARNFNKKQPDNRSKLNTSHIGIQGEPSPVYISEHLSGNGRRLFFLSREFAKKYNMQFWWISNRKIYIKKDKDSSPIRIETEQTLSDLANKI